MLRRERRVRSREIAGTALPDPPSDRERGDQIDVQAIHAALATLPPRQRDVIEGLKFRDESVREDTSPITKNTSRFLPHAIIA